MLQILLDHSDFVSSSVLFIRDVIADSNSKLKQILNDSLIKNTASKGIIILNLNNRKIIDYYTAGKEKIAAFSQTLFA